MNDNDWACEMNERCMAIKGIGWRVAFSALSLLLWFTFLITWLFFLADDYGILQNIGVLLMSAIVMGAINIPVWFTFARAVEGWSELSHKEHRQSVVGGVSALIWVVGVALWLFLYAGDYSLYQNIAVLLLSLVPLAAVNMLMAR